MHRYVIKRLLLFLPTALFVALMLFALLRIVPGDAIDGMFEGDDSRALQITAAERAKIRAELGLDKSLPVQFLQWAWGALRFDFGTSFWQKRSNLEIIRERLPSTIELAALSLVFATAWGITLGIVAAVKQDTWIDNAIRLVTVGGIALPAFFTGVIFYAFLVNYFRWIPPLQYASLLSDPWKNIQQVIWPTLVMGFGAGAIIARLTRSQFLEVIREDYIRTARAKGLRETVVTMRHALRNSLLPVLTMAGTLFAHLLGGVVIVEIVFAVPGMGVILVNSVNTRDYALLQAMVWVITLIYMVTNLIVDLAYGWIDPRISLAKGEA